MRALGSDRYLMLWWILVVVGVPIVCSIIVS